MRALVLVALAACTPDVVSGAYLCGPEASCPEGQSCSSVQDTENGPYKDVCVLSSTAMPFACMPKMDLEPDDTMDEAHLIPGLGCVSSFMNDGCMLESDSADWVTFVAPASCSSAISVQARISFSIAYEELGLELWNVDQNMKVASDEPCKSGLDSASIRSCIDYTLVPGTKYGLKVSPNGNASCGGACAYNRYTLTIQLATPG